MEGLATFCWNNQEHLEAYYATPCMGTIVHTLNIRLPAQQLRWPDVRFWLTAIADRPHVRACGTISARPSRSSVTTRPENAGPAGRAVFY